MTRHYWHFQGHTDSAKVCQQEITELTELAHGIIEFERKYLNTHGERTPAFRMLSMINQHISEHIDAIERKFIEGDLIEKHRDRDSIPL